MFRNIKVTAEHNELILENSHGDKVIIPANKRNWVKQKLSEGCHNCIDSLVETLPIASQYAQDGSVYPPNKKVKVNQDNQIKEYDISSPEYRDLYNTGKLMNYDKNTDTYIATPLKEVTITAEAPQWSKYKREYEKTNPKSDYINRYLTPFAKSLGNTETNYPKRLDDEYEQKTNQYIVQQVFKNNPIKSDESRGQYLDRLVTKEYTQDILDENGNIIHKKGDKFRVEQLDNLLHSNLNENDNTRDNVWRNSYKGLKSLIETNPEQTFQRILSDNSMSWKEKSELLKDYSNSPILSKVKETLGIIEPLSIPYNATIGNLYTQQQGEKDYNWKKALSGNVPKNQDALLSITADPLNLFGVGLASKLSKADKVIDATKAGSKVLNKTDDVVKTAISSVDDVNKSVKPAWQTQELPGLHLKSTMEGEAISKIVEPKTGMVNVEQALAIIGKESGGADKVALIKQGLGDNIPKKMDYNEFRKTVQDQLIPLERQFATHASNYGVGSLGYPSPKRSSFESAIKHANIEKNKQLQIIKEYEGYLKNPSKYKKAFPYESNLNKTNDELIPHIKSTLDDYKQRLAASELQLSKNLEDMKQLPLENQTLILGNKGKFGRGSSAHGNPDETLGHIHFLRDAETPDVLTVTQIQSDAFQGTHRIMPKDSKNLTALEKQQKSLARMEELQERNKSILHKMKTEGLDEAGLPVQDYQIKQFEDIVKAQEQSNLFKKADIENFTQKQLLDKNHQERYLQELVDYAGKRGDVNKVRVPTSETAAKVQGYAKVPTERPQGFEGYWDVNTSGNYSPEHQTILKKYSEQPKTIKKLFGEEPKIVTDSKGNTWYEFDIPKKFKNGKGEIKAFTTVGAIGTGTATLSQQQNKNKQ